MSIVRTPIVSYHVVRTQIANGQPLSLFLHIGISTYQKSILPYTLFPTYFSQAYSPLEHS
jgi:hypothetical protein